MHNRSPFIHVNLPHSHTPIGRTTINYANFYYRRSLNYVTKMPNSLIPLAHLHPCPYYSRGVTCTIRLCGLPFAKRDKKSKDKLLFFIFPVFSRMRIE